MKEMTPKDFWQWENTKERLGIRLKLWDKKLSKLDTELLYYVLMRSQSILDYRAEKEQS